MNETVEKSFPTPATQRENKEKLDIKILLADDEKSIRFMVPLNLRPMGCIVETVSTGEELIARLDSAKPGEFGLVIADNNMGSGIRGIDAIASIRADGRFKDLPIILHSGMPDGELLRRVTSLNSMFLEKPADSEKFKTTIQEALAKFKK